MITGAAQKSANLSYLTNAATARSNLGLGTAAIADVVGTMGGGAIIERGSNANGEYVKFADGPIICTHAGFELGYSSGAAIQAVWTYPSQFIDTPFISLTRSSVGADYSSSVEGLFRMLSPHYSAHRDGSNIMIPKENIRSGKFHTSPFNMQVQVSKEDNISKED